MELQKFYIIQLVIDDLRLTRKRVPRRLRNIIELPMAEEFLIYNRLNLLELCEFHNCLDLKITKKLLIERLEHLKLGIMGHTTSFKLPTAHLQNLADFIENYKDRLTDYEYLHDLDLLKRFY